LYWIDGVNAKAVENKTESELANQQSHAVTFAKALNGRKQSKNHLGGLRLDKIKPVHGARQRVYSTARRGIDVSQSQSGGVFTL